MSKAIICDMCNKTIHTSLELLTRKMYLVQDVHLDQSDFGEVVVDEHWCHTCMNTARKALQYDAKELDNE